MRRFIGYFRDFHQEYFSFKAYILSLTFIAAFIAFNYWVDFEDSIIDSYSGTLMHTLLFSLTHAFAFFVILMIFQLSGKRKAKFNREAWVKMILAFLIVGIDRSFYLYRDFFSTICSPETYRFTIKAVNNLIPFLTVMLPLFIIKWFFDRDSKEGLYGLMFKNVNIKAYWVMLALMMPLVFIASLTPEFIDYYPVYKRSGGAIFAEAMGIPEIAAQIMYEWAYLMNFIFVELFFRGFLVIGLSRILGGNVVMAMAGTYAVYHFGKPIGETISSVFGGYILGVIALYSRNIYGGIFIHGGIALAMEFFAFLQMN